MMRVVLRRPDFRLLFAGMVASTAGETVLVLALAIWVKGLTGSDGLAGATILALVAPMALAPLVGWLVDRFRRRPFLVVALVAAALGLTPLYAVRSAGQVWVIYAVATGYGLSYVAVSAAYAGLIKLIMPEELLADANGALQTVRQALRLIGPLLGAALYTVVGGWAVAVVAMTGLLVAAATIAALRVREARPPRAELRWLAEVGAGLRHVVGPPALRRAVVGVALALLVLGFLESLIFAYVDRGLHRPPGFVGVLAAVQGTGGVLGGLLAARVVRAVGELVALALGVLGFGLGCLGFSHPNLPLGIAAMGVAGVGLPIATVGFQTLLQRLTPAELIGRVSATADALISGPQAASIAIGAVLVTVVDYRLLLAAMGVTLVAVAGYLWTGRRLVAAAASGGAGQLGEALLDLEDGRVG